MAGKRDRFRALGGPGVALLLPQQRASPACCVCQSKAKHKVRSEAANWRWQKARQVDISAVTEARNSTRPELKVRQGSQPQGPVLFLAEAT